MAGRGDGVPTEGQEGSPPDLRRTGRAAVATYSVNEAGVARARELIDARQYVLRSE